MSDHLVATLIDTVAVGNWLFVSAHTKGRNPKPKPMPRFGEIAAKKEAAQVQTIDSSQLASWFGVTANAR